MHIGIAMPRSIAIPMPLVPMVMWTFINLVKDHNEFAAKKQHPSKWQGFCWN